MKKRRDRPKVSLVDRIPEFFEFFHPDHNSQRLLIPPAFIKHFNQTIPDKAILKDFVGNHWDVDIEKAENGLFIKNGWQGFVNDSSLELGDFVVLRYNGSSIFTVRIFGRSGCKKEEAVAIKKTLSGVKTEEETEDETEGEQTYCKSSHICKRKYSEIGLKRLDKSRCSQQVTRLKAAIIASKIITKHEVFEAAEFASPKNPCFTANVRPSRPSILKIPKPLGNQVTLKPEVNHTIRTRSSRLNITNPLGNKGTLKPEVNHTIRTRSCGLTIPKPLGNQVTLKPEVNHTIRTQSSRLNIPKPLGNQVRVKPELNYTIRTQSFHLNIPKPLGNKVAVKPEVNHTIRTRSSPLNIPKPLGNKVAVKPEVNHTIRTRSSPLNIPKPLGNQVAVKPEVNYTIRTRSCGL